MRLAAALMVMFAASTARADAPTGGVRGTVIFEGEAPDAPTVGGDAGCAARPSAEIVVHKGKLADVVIRVIASDALPPRRSTPLPPATVELRDCAYTPRVVVLEPHQRLVIDHARAAEVVAGIAGGPMLDVRDDHGRAIIDAPEPVTDEQPVIGLSLAAHPWVRGYAVRVGNALHAVTAADGSFEILGLPPGRYELEAIHPALGTRHLEIVVGTGNKAIAQARLSYKRGE